MDLNWKITEEGNTVFKILLILIIVTSVFNLACDSPTETSGNNQPEIREILVSPLPVRIDVWTDITAVATDQDGDSLTYFWSSSEGEFSPGKTASNPTLWKVLNVGIHTITCTVSDGKDTASKSISVDVTNTQLLGRIEFQRQITDVSGYVDSAGKEYALVGFSGGIYIVDGSNPQAPVLVATIDIVPGFDVKVWQNYAYTVNGGGDGLGGIIDLADPADPKVIGSFPSGHNIFIDDSGYMYLETGNLQLRIFNLNPDPVNPDLVWSGGPLDGHDATVIENRLYDFAGFSGTNIYDVTNPASPRLLGLIKAPFVSFHHSGWPSEDGNFIFICNELAPSDQPDLTIWDIRDPSNPKFVTEFSDASTNIHNFYIIGDFAYTSYYNAGFRVFDVSDPTDLRLVGEFDTSPNTNLGGLFQGAFGVYPFAPSGNIYVTDITDGLFIFSSHEN